MFFKSKTTYFTLHCRIKKSYKTIINYHNNNLRRVNLCDFYIFIHRLIRTNIQWRTETKNFEIKNIFKDSINE